MLIYFLLAFALLGLGLIGLVVKRDYILRIIGGILMFNGIILLYVLFAQTLASIEGHVFAFMMIVMTALFLVVALALRLALFNQGNADD